MRAWLSLYSKFILTFFLARLVVTLFFIKSFAELSITGWLTYIWVSFAFDSCVISCILLLLLLFNPLWLKRPALYKKIVLSLLFILLLVSVADLFHMYRYGVRFNYFSFLQTDGTVLWAVFTGKDLYIAIAVSILFFFLLKRFLFRDISTEKLAPVKFLPLLMIFFSTSFLYYPVPLYRLSDIGSNTLVNEAAKNTVYCISSSLYTNSSNGEKIPDVEMSEEEALKIVARITGGEIIEGVVVRKTVKDTLRRTYPHIVLIVMESMGSNIFSDSLAPNLSALAKEGIYFPDCKATGPRTQMAIASLLTGVPNILCNNFYRLKGVNKIETVADYMKEAGYTSSVIHNGFLSYDDADKFLKEGGFDELIDANDMPGAKMKNEWGVEDEQLFDRALSELKKHKSEKTFHVLQSISNHEPYTLPTNFADQNPQIRKWDKKLQTYYYADRMLGDFIAKLKKETFYDSTLILITGDHGEARDESEFADKIFYVPLVVLNVGKGVGDSDHSHIDIPYSLVSLVRPGEKTIMLGRDIFSKQKPLPLLSGNYGTELGLVEGTYLYSYAINSQSEKVMPSMSVKESDKMKKTTFAYYKLVRYYLLKGKLKRP